MAVNVTGRNVSKGQRAMAIAKVFPDPEQVGRGRKGILNIPFSKQYLSHARIVLKLLPAVADEVLAGAKPPIARLFGSMPQRIWALPVPTG